MKYRIREIWNDYRARVMPANAGPIQVQESRRAFYAGAQAFFGIQLHGLDKEDQEPTEDDMKMMDELHAELNEFAQDIKEGRA
jgi:hypothetical protein